MCIRDRDYGIDIGNAMMNYTEKEQSMKTLKEVACGQTVKVKKLTGDVYKRQGRQCSYDGVIFPCTGYTDDG